MAHKLHHPEVIKIRNRYHLARRHQDWPRIKALAASGDAEKVKQAHALAKAAVSAPARTLALQRGARVALASKQAFLRVQKKKEQVVRAALADLAAQAAAILRRHKGSDGLLAPRRVHAVLTALKAENRAAYKRVNTAFLGLVRTGAKGGILAAMAIAVTIKNSLKKSRAQAAKEGDLWHLPVQHIGQQEKTVLVEESPKLSNPLDSTPEKDKLWITHESSSEKVIHRLSTVQPIGQLNYNNLSNPLDKLSNPLYSQLAPYKVLKERKERERRGARVQIFLREADDAENDMPDPALQTVTYGVDSGVFQRVFTGAMRQTMEAGLFGATGISNKVWDLRDQNFLILKRLVAAGIANGDSPGEIADAIQQLLVQPNPFDSTGAGPGVYKSAWKNAMRLARNESNRAYGAANALFAAEKDWTVIWHVSEGQREEDECDYLDGEEMTPDEFMDKFPQHPNCMCYSTLAVPEHEDDVASDDEPSEPGDAGAAD